MLQFCIDVLYSIERLEIKKKTFEIVIYAFGNIVFLTLTNMRFQLYIEMFSYVYLRFSDRYILSRDISLL